MSGDDVAVVWVAPEGAQPGARTGAPEGREDAARALAEWGRARGLRLVAPSEGPGTAAIRVDLAVADRVEKELDRAREAIAALEGDAAERALARAEAALREHPELPQAAWLRAEVHRSWAARWTRIEPRDDQRALLAWQDAEALDGGRAAGIGETAFPARPHTTATVRVQGGAGRKVVARLDGAPLSLNSRGTDGTTTFAIDVPAGEHQLVITLDADPVFASWVAVAEVASGSAPAVIPIQLGDDGTCSAASFAGVVREGGGARASGVSCPRWVLATTTERQGAVLVARCERSTCGPFLEWRSESSLGGGGPAQAPATHGGKWPAWATWTALGVGAVAATTITLIATGVFESRPTETRFVAGGVRTE